MSRGSIRLSEKHGVNPTLGVCFICGGDTGEIGLLGRLPNDAEAPRKAVLLLEPCAKCKEKVTIAEAEIVPGSMPDLTGRFAQLTDETFKEVFGDQADALKKRLAFMHPTEFAKLWAMIQAGHEGEDAAKKAAGQ